jgi:hypothetical protein
VFSVPIASALAALPQFPVSDPTPNTPIHIIGHPAAGEWTIWPGTIGNENAPNGDFHRFTTNRDPSLTGGYSGGPTFDSRGTLYGMHVCTTASYAKELKIKEIIAALSSWHVPTNKLIDGSAKDLDKDVRRIFDGVGPISWIKPHLAADFVNGGDQRINSKLSQRLEFIKLEGCNLSLRTYYTWGLGGSNFMINNDYAIDLSDVSFRHAKCCEDDDMFDVWPKNGDSVAYPQFFPKGGDVLTIASTPGFKTIKYQSLQTFADNSRETHSGQFAGVNLFYDDENALNTAFSTLQTAKKSCSVAQ